MKLKLICSLKRSQYHTSYFLLAQKSRCKRNTKIHCCVCKFGDFSRIIMKYFLCYLHASSTTCGMPTLNTNIAEYGISFEDLSSIVTSFIYYNSTKKITEVSFYWPVKLTSNILNFVDFRLL